MHNANTRSRKAKQTSSTFQGYGLARYEKSKSDIAISKKRDSSHRKDKKQKKAHKGANEGKHPEGQTST